MQCHNTAAGGALGLRTWQLNGSYSYPGTTTTANQLQVWHIGVYDATLTAYRAQFVVDLTAATVNLPPCMLPIPIYEAAGSQIQGVANGAGNAKTIVVKLAYLVGV